MLLLDSSWPMDAYVSRVEGTGPSSLDECRDLFLETKWLNAGGPLHQYRLGSAVTQHVSPAFHHTSKMCVRTRYIVLVTFSGEDTFYS